MARYRYMAVDPEGKPVSGEIEASGVEDARAKLAALAPLAQGAVLEEIAPLADSGQRLSAGDAAQLGAQVAQVAKAGLPLGQGLRAMAGELSRRRLRAILLRIADRIDAGVSLESAVDAEGPRIPEHIRCLLKAGVRSGRFPEVLDQLVAVERMRMDAARRLRLLLAYPTLLLLVILLLYCLFSFGVVPQFRSIFRDFGADLPALTQFMITVCSPTGAVTLLAIVAVLVAAAALCFAGRSRAAWLQRALYLVPLVGPGWRFRGLAEFSRLMGLLLELRVPLPQALYAVADGLREGDLRAACRTLAQLVEAGVSLSDGLTRLRAFPSTFRPVLRWGEQAPALAEAFRGTAEMCEGRLRFHGFFLDSVLLPMMLVVVMFFVGFFATGLLLPLISLIQHLS